ncbi:hypothetical protein D3C85_1045140 [compost metagenome]
MYGVHQGARMGSGFHDPRNHRRVHWHTHQADDDYKSDTRECVLDQHGKQGQGDTQCNQPQQHDAHGVSVSEAPDNRVSDDIRESIDAQQPRNRCCAEAGYFGEDRGEVAECRKCGADDQGARCISGP